MMSAPFLFDSYRELSQTNREAGAIFERFIQKYLLTDPEYSARYSKVWLWSEWPGRGGQPNTGIDLVAFDEKTGEYTAIQCKFFAEKAYIDKADIDSFLATSGKKFVIDGKEHTFSYRLIVSSTERWGKNAEEAIHDQAIPVFRIGLSDIANAPMDWDYFSAEKPETLRLSSKKSIRPHQEKALNAVMEGFTKSQRGKLI